MIAGRAARRGRANAWYASPMQPRLALLALVLAFAACKDPSKQATPSAEHAHAEHAHASADAPPALPSGTNPVQNEMRVLHEAARDWVTAVANGTLETIPASI